MRIVSLASAAALLLVGSLLPKATMGQTPTTEQFLALYNMTSFFFEHDERLPRKLVRMAFHDAMGGVDAHLDMTNDEHDGLNRTFAFLNRLWEINNKMLSMNGTYSYAGGHKGNHTMMGNHMGGREGRPGRGFGDRQIGGREGRGQGGRPDGQGRGFGGSFGGGQGGGGGRGGRGQGGEMMRGRNRTDTMMGGMMGRGNHTHGGRKHMMMRLMRHLEPVPTDGLTKADFFAWVYIAALYHTCRRHVPWVPLRFGRTTFEEAQLEDTPPLSEFGSGNHAAVLAYFEDNFGFNEGQVAVLLGAHTLGGAGGGGRRGGRGHRGGRDSDSSDDDEPEDRDDMMVGDNGMMMMVARSPRAGLPERHGKRGGRRKGSDFVGDWTSSPGVFNNEYYENLIFPGGRGGWEQIAVANDTKFEWRWGCNNRCRDLMLNVDMNLFYNLDPYFVDGGNGQVRLPDPLPETAPVALCSDPEHVFAVCFPERTGPTQALVTLLEDGNTEMFLDNFALVFGDMISRVKDGATLGYVAPPADWPNALRMGRRGRGGRGGRGPPGRGGGRGPPRGCDMDDVPEAIGFDGEIVDEFIDGADYDGFDEDFDGEEEFPDEEFLDEEEEEEEITEEEEEEPVAETPSATGRNGDPFTRRGLRVSA